MIEYGMQTLKSFKDTFTFKVTITIYIIFYKSTTMPFILTGALLGLYGYITLLLQFHVLSSGRLLLPEIDSNI